MDAGLNYVKKLKGQHYKFFGKREHAAAKLCLWTKKSIRNRGFCYKQAFYGVESHRCLQMSPNVYCQLRCVFCWRTWEHEPLNYLPEHWDEPKELVEESIVAQKKLLSGLGGVEDTDRKKFKEAQEPNQIAISLDGEPTMYPYLGELIGEYHKRNATTFLVSNGLLPERLEALEPLPTQLYISLYGPDKQTHQKTNNPLTKDSWEKLNESLELFPSLDTRKVIRLTMVKGVNMIEPKKYADLIKIAQPDFIEAKGYMFVGGSRQRLAIENMPTHDEIRQFALDLNKHLDYRLIGEKKDSRVVLLSNGEKDAKIRKET
jgi:tRNA wybutosine-synthesizing protein 1